MPLEVKIGDRIAEVKLLKQDRNFVTISIDNKVYDLDIEMVENGVYSILHNGHSYNVELIEGSTAKKYYVNTLYQHFDVEIIDAQSKYLQNRKKNLDVEGGNVISSPMPGKVVRIPVKVGDDVKIGQTVIVISAMKMESDYKSAIDGKVKEINVKEGSTIEGNQPLVVIE